MNPQKKKIIVRSLYCLFYSSSLLYHMGSNILLSKVDLTVCHCFFLFLFFLCFFAHLMPEMQQEVVLISVQ